VETPRPDREDYGFVHTRIRGFPDARGPRAGEARGEEETVLDFTEGWAWFVAGLGVTAFAAALLVAVVLVAGRPRRRSR
jgi:hypothetical protein